MPHALGRIPSEGGMGIGKVGKYHNNKKNIEETFFNLSMFRGHRGEVLIGGEVY